MTIFNRTNAPSSSREDEDFSLDGDASFEDSLSAPQRGGVSQGGGKKTGLLLVLLLLAGGGFAALFFIGGEDASLAPPPVAALDANAPVAADGSTPPADPLAANDLPVDPASPAAMPVDPGAPVTPVADAEMPPMPDAAPVAPAVAGTATATDASVAAAPVPVQGGSEQTAEPVSADIDPAAPAVASTPEAAPALPETPAVPEAAAAPEAAQAPAEGVAAADLTPAVQPAPVDSAVGDPAPENATLENAASVSDPGNSPEDIIRMWSTLPVENAMVRPMPKSYVTVKKEQSADTLDSRLATARRALNDGRTAAALQFFTDLQADYPTDGRVLMGRAVTLQRLGQNAEALSSYEAVLTNDPKNLDALTNMLGLLRQQNPQLAVDKLTELRALYPYNADIATQLAVTHGQAGNLNEALRYITLAEALKPESSYVLYNKAVLYDRLGRTTEAADMYRQIIRRSADGTLEQNLPIESIKKRLAVMR